MGHPADTATKVPAAFAGARLSPEEAERLASTFRPSWELDDAPFTGPGSLTDSELRALQGGGIHPDVRAVALDGHSRSHASNGAHPAAVPTQSHEPENSVIIDRSITADAAPAPSKPPPPVRPGGTMLGMAPPPAPAAVKSVPPPAPPVSLQRPPTPVSRRPAAPDFLVPPPVATRAPTARVRPVSIDLEEGYPKKSKTGLWVGVGVGGAIVLGLVVWLASGSSDKPAEPAATTATAAADKPSFPPPAAATPAPPTTTVAATPPPAPPPATVAAAPPPTPIPTTPVTALPQAAPVPTHVAAAAVPRSNYGSASPAPRPAGKSKGQTIVRDVPF